MPTTSAIAYLRARLIEAQTQNADDSRAARTPEERAFVNGQRHLLQAFSAWLDLAASGHAPLKKETVECAPRPSPAP